MGIIDHNSKHVIGIGMEVATRMAERKSEKLEAGFEILGLDHVVLRVADTERSLAFYCDLLGCSLERRLDELGLIQLRAGHSLIDIVPLDGELGRKGGVGPATEGRNLDHFCLRIDPFDAVALRARLDAAKVSYSDIARRYGADGFGPSLYLEDPDGNVVELKGQPEPP